MIRKYLFLFLLVLTLSGCSGCDLADYSDEIRKVMNPLGNKLVAFYKKNNHYPNDIEMKLLLQKSGCKQVVDNKCFFSENFFAVSSQVNNRGAYGIEFKLGNSRCYVGLFENGNLRNVSCRQDSCLGLKQ